MPRAIAGGVVMLALCGPAHGQDVPRLASVKIEPFPSAIVAIFVGPQTRDGFIDVDAGILDSIRDIQGELKRSRRFTLAQSADRATIVLLVVGRRTPGSSGSIGVPIGNIAMFLPVKRRAVDTILRVGTYEKPITSEAEDNDSWRASARQVVRDVTAWVDANQQAIAGRRP
jgi:hypothetical protein